MSNLILFAGGGTGGHLFPGIALAEALFRIQPAARVLFVGSDREVERRIMADSGYPHTALPLCPLRSLWKQPGRFFWRNCRAVAEAAGILRRERPRAVIGLGGLSSVPTVLAAHRAGVPIILLEQNAIPGRATRWLGHFARVICVSFPECIDHLPRRVPVIACGNPVRAEIARLLHEPAAEHLKSILILGGSQGAESLNAAALTMVRQHRSQLCDWTILHQTGPRHAASIEAAYCALQQPRAVSEFFPNMADQYRRADIIISRAGATTLAELSCAGKPMLLVPYPHAADNHQLANANAFVRQGAAAVVKQSPSHEETAANLWSALQPWLNDPARRKPIGDAARTLARPDAAERIIALVNEALRFAA